MELTDLVEQAILADFLNDDLLSRYAPVVHDDSSPPNQQPYAFSITANDRGDFQGAPGTGIKMIALQIEIQYNLGVEAEREPRTDELAKIAERIGDRLPSISHDLQQARDVLQRLSSAQIKVFLISADETETRTNLVLTRSRIVTRELICARIA
jgi:hypothetical protein